MAVLDNPGGASETFGGIPKTATGINPVNVDARQPDSGCPLGSPDSEELLPSAVEAAAQT